MTTEITIPRKAEDGFGNYYEFLHYIHHPLHTDASGFMYILGDDLGVVGDLWTYSPIKVDKDTLWYTLDDLREKRCLGDGAYEFSLVLSIQGDSDGYQCWVEYEIECGKLTRLDQSPMELKYGALTIPRELFPVPEYEPLPF